MTKHNKNSRLQLTDDEYQRLYQRFHEDLAIIINVGKVLERWKHDLYRRNLSLNLNSDQLTALCAEASTLEARLRKLAEDLPSLSSPNACEKCQAVTDHLFPVDAMDFIIRKGVPGGSHTGKDLDVDYETKQAIRWICGTCVRG
jgi:hypothetical protein